MSSDYENVYIFNKHVELNEESLKIDKIDLLDNKFFHLLFW